MLVRARLVTLCFTVGALVCSSVLFLPNPAAAQESHWGVTASFVPQWKPIRELWEQLWEDEFDADGTEFRIGIVRGSDLGGDWSVSFLKNKISTEREFDDTFVDDFFDPPVRFGSVYFLPENPEVIGIKYEKFTPFVTFQDRVQIGLTYGGGYGVLRGTLDERVFDAEFGFDPNTFENTATQTETLIQQEVKDFYKLEFVPIGSVEAAAAFILAPGLKVRVTGGFNFPHTQVISFTVNYLIGS